MGQVPHIAYGIIGSGRLASHLGHYFKLLGIPYRTWSRKDAASPLHALQDCQTLLLAVTDSAIEPLAKELKTIGLAGKPLVHFSGSLMTPMAYGVHPLMSFGPDLYDLATYESIAFVTEAGGSSFESLFPALRNPRYAIPSELKPLYHSLCVMGGNFTVLLWQKLFLDFQSKLGIPWEAAVPYLRRVADNLSASPDRALSGPIARKDYETIEKNLESLSGDSFATIYRAFLDVFLPEFRKGVLNP